MVLVPRFRSIPEEEVRNKSDRKFVDDGGRWIQENGDELVVFCERFITPTRGPSAATNVKLLPWQEAEYRRWACWIGADGTRRFRKGCLFCCRQQGKSFYSVGLSTYCFLADNEPGAYVVCCAVQREQVKKVWFNEIWSSFQSWEPQYRSYIKPVPSLLRLECPATKSELQGLSSSGWSKLGSPPSMAVLDEAAFWDDYTPLTAIESGMASRRQPFLLMVSTSGTDRTTPAYEWWQRGQAILEDATVDVEFQPIIFTSKPEDPIDDPKTWARAAPSLGFTIPVDEFRKEAEQASKSKVAELSFRQFKLNQWTATVNQFLNLDRWADCRVEKFPELKGLPAYVSVDQSSSGGDLTAVVWLVPHGKRLYLNHHAWVSREGMRRVDESHNATKYSKWEKCGWLTIHEGNTVDYDDMRQFIKKLCKEFKVKAIAMDPGHNANDTFLNLQSEGYPVEMYGSSARFMNEPMRKLSDLVDNGTLAHLGDELMTWQSQNLESKKNTYDQLVPCKPERSAKIDTMIALLYSVAMYVKHSVVKEKEFNPHKNKWEIF